MIGRATIGNPWFFKQVKHFMETELSFHNEYVKCLGKYGVQLDDLNLLENNELPYFNLQEGKFQANSWEHCVTGEKLELLKPFLGTKFDTSLLIELSSSQKQELLNMILGYFKLHLQGFKHPKSLTVLSQVYS